MLARSPAWTAAAAAATRLAAALAETRSEARVAAMDDGEVYAHYNHTDSCHQFRWTARESYQYMYERPWEKVVDFYSDLVRSGKGATGLRELFRDQKCEEASDCTENYDASEKKLSENIESSKDKARGRWERVTFKIVLTYHGNSFDGWQKQPGLNTVQGLVEKSLGKFVDEKKMKKLKEKSLPIEGCVVVAGRTDKGVTALHQVCSFYTWRKDVKGEELREAINEIYAEKLKVLSVSKVSRVFHPTFAAKWRRYFYIFPLDNNIQTNTNNKTDASLNHDFLDFEERENQEEREEREDSSTTVHDAGMKPKSFSVRKVDQIIRQLEGKLLSYKIFARDTQASRSSGPATECFMFHSRSTETVLPCTDQDSKGGARVLCVELVANRFLRKMVRVIVATAIREAVASADHDVLIKLMGATCRRATAPPAPPDGLCLVDVGYGEFSREDCLILD